MPFDPTKLHLLGRLSEGFDTATLTAPTTAPRVPTNDAADLKLGMEIAEALKPEGWDGARVHALASEMALLSSIQRFQLGQSVDADGEKKRSVQLKKDRDQAENRAKIFQAAAIAFLEAPERTERLLWPQPFAVKGFPISMAPVTPTARPKDPSTLLGDLTVLARREALIVARLTVALHLRSRSADEPLVEWMGVTLHRLGIKPSAHFDAIGSGNRRRRVQNIPTGNLVTACAMMRGEDPTKAGWVVKAAERVRKQYKKLPPDSEPNPWTE